MKTFVLRLRNARVALRALGLAVVILAANLATDANAAEPRGTRESVRVHGHWTIDVRNPDGTLARHADFENGLCLGAGSFLGPGSGDSLIAMMLGGALSSGSWEVVLSTVPIPTGANPGPPCAITTPTFQLWQNNSAMATGPAASQYCAVVPGCFTTLNPPSYSATFESITLAGQFTVPTGFGSATITAVGTGLFVCSSNLLASACLAQIGIGTQVTGAYLTGVPPMPAAITVVAGQTVAVNVTLSFH